jgi:deazaflavin-dependent oxidoreductase (nitroreductase family)
MAVLSDQSRYRAPGWFDLRVINPLIAGLSRVGLSFAGSRVLEVPGRRSGELRRNPVNPLVVDGQRYLVAPRGQTEWVRNLRCAGEGELLLGRRREHFHATEIADSEKPEILRAYLTRWKWEVGQFFEGVGPNSPPGALARIAHQHPVFLVRP